MMAQALPAGLTLRCDESTGTLIARFEPGDGRTPPGLSELKAAIAAEGFGELKLDEKGLQSFLRRTQGGKDAMEAVIGERVDGTFDLHISDDLMSVWLTLTPPQGGKSANQAVIEALRKQGITFGLLEGSLNSALASGECHNLLIAEGTPPEEGTPARFESLLPAVSERRPQVDAYGIVDYRNLGQLQVVQEGEPLLRRIPPQQGKDGTNVKGQPVSPLAIPDQNFATGLSGVALAQGDPNLLIAALTGLATAVERGYNVNPVIEVANVDLTSGNIAFKGTVKVLGDIKSGMRVDVTGDILVAGTIEAAEVSAGGNIVITGGIVGNSQGRNSGNEEQASTAKINCRGSVTARFAENAVIRAGHTIEVHDIALECELLAGEQILIGKSGGKYGQMIGGHARATKLIRAMVLGSTSGAVTRLQVGLAPHIYEKLTANERSKTRLLSELQQVEQLLTHFVSNPEKGAGGIRERAERTRDQLQAQLTALNTESEHLIAQARQMEAAAVEIGREVFIGTVIQIGGRTWRAMEDLNGACKIKLENDRIILA
jgi:uncharacterized protein (DUF342 family)